MSLFVNSCNHFLLLSADSPVLTSRVAVTVQVLDINEFPPELASPYETFVCENAKPRQVCFQLLTSLLLSDRC